MTLISPPPARQQTDLIRSYDADHSVWDYELIESNESFPEEAYMEILGSRKPILFIEGTDTNSIDSKLYPFIFPDYLVKPMGGCQKQSRQTKAFGQLKDFHTLDSKGIVDRDRRTQGEINHLREQHIYVPDVAEVENLLMIEDVDQDGRQTVDERSGRCFQASERKRSTSFPKRTGFASNPSCQTSSP